MDYKKKLPKFMAVGLLTMAIIGILADQLGSSIAYAFAISTCFTIIALAVKLWDDIEFYKTFEGKIIIGISIFNIISFILIRIWGNHIIDMFGFIFIIGIVVLYTAIMLYKAGVFSKIFK